MDQQSVLSVDHHDDVSRSDDETKYFYELENNRLLGQKSKDWDVFRYFPHQDENLRSSDEKFFILLKKTIKIIIFAMTFFIVLATSVVSKLSMLLMTSQVGANKAIAYCNITRPNSQLAASLSDSERYRWIWCLLLTFLLPNFISTGIALVTILFKGWSKERWILIMEVVLVRLLSSLGMSLLLLSVLPDMDSIRGAMVTNGLCSIPAVGNLIYHSRKERKNAYVVVADGVAILLQIVGMVSLAYFDRRPMSWTISLCLFLISFGWYENYSRRFNHWNHTLQSISGFVGVTSFAIFVLLIIWIQEESLGLFLRSFKSTFTSQTVTVRKAVYLSDESMLNVTDIISLPEVYETMTGKLEPLLLALVQVTSSYFCYLISIFVCKATMQKISFSLPLLLTVPVTINALILLTGMRYNNVCVFYGFLPNYLFFESQPVNIIHDSNWYYFIWIWLLWFISQSWVTINVWKTIKIRLLSSDQLFFKPYFDSLLLDQNLLMNMKISTDEIKNNTANKSEDKYASGKTSSKEKTTMIYICAMLGQERNDVLCNLMKSILLMDEDQWTRRMARKYLKVTDPDYYDLESHIFIDVEFDKHNGNTSIDPVTNKLVKAMEHAMELVHGKVRVKMNSPIVCETPYGGRLLWTMPGRTKLICHLKDKEKVRSSEQWSQVMCFYYLLGHLLMESDISVDEKEAIANKMYILCLEGRAQFKPEAVLRLVDLIKKNQNCGVACSRIHPTGSGPLVWYQKFEYALEYWFQKSTQHVLGCVMNVSNQFMLINAKALMDDNILKKYAVWSNDANHLVICNEGYGKWLTILMLQAGYCIQYSAASNVYVECIGDFQLFCNSRIKSIASQYLIFLKFVQSIKSTCIKNDNITLVYIGYIILLLLGHIFSPSFTVLVLMKSLTVTLNVADWTVFWFYVIPLCTYAVISSKYSSKLQIYFTAVLALILGLLTIIVLVAASIKVAEGSFLTPTGVIILSLLFLIITAVLLHPTEIGKIPNAVVYFMLIPLNFVLLPICAISNIHKIDLLKNSGNVKMSNTARTKVTIAMSLQEKYLKDLKRGYEAFGSEGSLKLSFGDRFSCVCCVQPKSKTKTIRLLRITAAIESLEERINDFHMNLEGDILGQEDNRTSRIISSQTIKLSDTKIYFPNTDDVLSNCSLDNYYDYETNFNWMNDANLNKCEIEFLPTMETKFWISLMETYLQPIYLYGAERIEIVKTLKNLRNMMSFGFLMLNALCTLTLFLLHVNIKLRLKWPWAQTYHMMYDTGLNEVQIEIKYHLVEPVTLGIFFVIFLYISIQYIGMILHSFTTLIHTLATTEVGSYWTETEKTFSKTNFIDENAVNIVKDIQHLKISTENYIDHKAGRRKAVHALKSNENKLLANSSLSTVFKENFFSLNDFSSGRRKGFLLKPHVINALLQRRKTIALECYA